MVAIAGHLWPFRHIRAMGFRDGRQLLSWPLDEAHYHYRLLATKYRFLATLNALASLTLIPLVVLGKIPFFSWISLLVFATGCINLVCMPTCLFSSRLDLFTSAFFNYQGANKFINFYSLIVLLPIGIWSFIDYFTSPLISDIVALTTGLIGLLIHPLLLRQLATVYIARRHKRFEAYN